VDGLVRVWDVTERRLVRAIHTHLDIASARLSPDGGRLVVTSYAEGQRPAGPDEGPPLFLSPVVPRDLPPTLPRDLPAYLQSAFLWRLPSGPMRSFPANYPAYAAFSPNGSRIVTVGASLDVWMLRKRPEPHHVFRLALTRDATPSVEFASNNRYLLVDETVRDAVTGAAVLGGGVGSTARFSSSGYRFAVVPPGRHATIVLDAGGRDISTLPFRQVVGLAGDGRLLATVQGGGLQIWSADRSRQVAALASVPSGVAQIAFGAGGDVAFVDNAGTGWIWSSRMRGEPRPLSDRRVNELAFGDRGRVLAATESLDNKVPGRVEVWRIQRGRGASQAGTPKIAAAGSDHSEAAVSDDGRYLAIWSTKARGPKNGTVRIRDLEEDAEVALLRPTVPFGSGLTFSPDARLLGIVAADGTLTIWDWRRNTRLRLVSSHGAAGAAAFSPDGRFVSLAIVGSPAGTFEENSPGGIDVFDARTGEEVLFRPAPGLDTVRQAGFASRDDAVIAVTSATTSGNQAAVRTFSCEVCLPLPELEKLGEERTTRELRCDEREQFLDRRCRGKP
jgi:WD40 repeat protein